MDFTDLQMTLTVVVVLTAAAIVVFFDYRRKLRQQQQQPQRVRVRSAARPQRPIRIFDATPLEYAPAKKLAAERPLEPLVGMATASRPPVEPLVGTATSSRPPVEPRMERETVTVQMASPHSGDSSFSTAVQLPAFTIDAMLWERLIASQPKHNLLTSSDSEPEPIAKSPAPPTLGSRDTVDAAFYVVQSAPRDEAPAGLPTGMIQKPVLQELLESGKPFTGLVVSIGVNDSDSSMWHSQGLMQSVGNFVATLLREKDFSCRTAYDEFVMVCWGEQGAQSQRRMNHISERLWDYQLRGMGACSILFSWGGVQVQDQPLSEAIESATERMRQTKRSGQSALTAVAHRQAV
jgi:hypothetical protein